VGGNTIVSVVVGAKVLGSSVLVGALVGATVSVTES